MCAKMALAELPFCSPLPTIILSTTGISELPKPVQIHAVLAGLLRMPHLNAHREPLLIIALQTLPRQQMSCTHFIPGKTEAGLCPSLQGGGESGPWQLVLQPSQILKSFLPLWLKKAYNQAGLDMSPALSEPLW